jgi:uncharacterized protein (DUF111 family)
MLLGALLHFVGDADAVAAELRGLGLCEFRLRVNTVERKGVTGYAAAVEIASPPAGGARAESTPSHGRHERDHSHGHDHDDDHHHHHTHIAYRDVAALISDADIGSKAKGYALAAYRALAEAEAAAHGTTTDEIHFHEVGSPRAIYTVTGAAIAAELIGVTDFTCGALTDGSGSVECAHGTIPVPVPAVRELLKQTEIPLVSDPAIKTELVTPSGLALLIGFGCRYVKSDAVPSGESGPFNPSDPFARNESPVTGYGFGSRDTGLLGAVRAVLSRTR